MARYEHIKIFQANYDLNLEIYRITHNLIVVKMTHVECYDILNLIKKSIYDKWLHKKKSRHTDTR